MKYLLTLLLLLGAAFGQNIRYDNIAYGPKGPVPFALVAICTQPATTSTQPCTPLAALCSSLSDLVCSQPNPVTTDSLGNFHVYVQQSIVPFTVQIYGPNVISPYIMTDQGSSPGIGTLFSAASPTYLGDWENTPMALSSAANGDFNQGTSNLVFFWMFRLLYTTTFNALSIKQSNITGGGTTVGIAIYSSAGNRLVHWDSIPYTSSSPPTGCNPGCTINATGGAVVLPPGYYYWAAAALSSNVSQQTAGGIVFSGSGEGVKPWNTRSVVRTGTAGNAMSAGVMPATLGTLSAGFPVGTNNLPVWIVEPN